MHDLVQKMFVEAYGGEQLRAGHDGAVFSPPAASRLAFTTDSYVVSPLFFPGGDIGSLSVHGTVNDLAMCGARPLYLSVALVIEEGLEMETLWRIVRSIAEAGKRCGVEIATGDTKVVDRGKADGLFVTTSGIGAVESELPISPGSVRPGDDILLSGDIGRHAVAILGAREGLQFEPPVVSDSAPVHETVRELMESGVEIHCMRDPTRGGLATTLVEISKSSDSRVIVNEEAIRVPEGVRGACEILGLDPLYMANEGRFLLFVPPSSTERAIAILERNDETAAVIGKVEAGKPQQVVLRGRLGAGRLLEMLSGEQLPRIC